MVHANMRGEHVHAARSGRSGVGHKLAIGMEAIFWIRHQWTLRGDPPMFHESMEPDPEGVVQARIEEHLGRRLRGERLVPVFEEITSVADEPPEIDVDPSDLSRKDIFGARSKFPFRWRMYPVRPVNLTPATARGSFYLKLDAAQAKLLDAHRDDHVLFVRADAFLADQSPCLGDILVCMIETGKKKSVCLARLIEWTGRDTPLKQGEHPPRIRCPLIHKDGSDNTYGLVPVKGTTIKGKPNLYAIGMRLERQLVPGRAV